MNIAGTSKRWEAAATGIYFPWKPSWARPSVLSLLVETESVTDIALVGTAVFSTVCLWVFPFITTSSTEIETSLSRHCILFSLELVEYTYD